MGCHKVMFSFTFIFLAILRMVLVLNSPLILWQYLSWIIHSTSLTKIKQTIKYIAATTWQLIYQAIMLGPISYAFICEYTTFLAFTFGCIPFKAVLQMVWLPTVGLLWWFNLYHNLLNDSDGRSMMTIFRNPTAGYPQDHINEERKRHSETHRFYRKSSSKPWKWRCQRKEQFIPPLYSLLTRRKRHSRAYMKSFPGTKRTAPIPTCFLPNH